MENKMKDTLFQIFNNYSYLTDKNILQSLLEKTDDKSLENIKSIDELKKFFYKLNQKVEIENIHSHLFILESNLNIVELSLDNCDENYASDLKAINHHNQKLLKEILVMLESKELISQI